MEMILIGILVLALLGQIASNVSTKKKVTQALESRPEALANMLEAPKPSHRLVRTWIVSTQEGRISAGWRWKCACGVWGVADNATHSFNRKDNTNSYDLGTEKEAINGFKTHAKQYLEVNTDYYKDLYEKTEADFAAYRHACYCKDANPDLIHWKDK